LITLDTWETIRLRCVRDREPVKTVACELGLSKNTVKKYIHSLQAPQHQSPNRTCRLDAYCYHIDNLIRRSPKITAVRIGAQLRAFVDPDLEISQRALREYVANRRREIVGKEAFVRALYVPADQMQFDFTPVDLVVAGVLTRVHLFVARLSYSGRLFARVSFREDQVALFAGMLGAVVHFGGVPRVGLFDNAKTAVTRILRGRNREENEAFRALCGGLALEVEFAAPAKGNQKGGVEGANGFLEDNVFRPTPECESLEAFNLELEWFCRNDENRKSSVHHETIGERFAREQPQLRPLPNVLPAACVRRVACINKFAEVVCDTNRYSVPTQWAHRNAVLEIFENRVRIVVDDQVVAEHKRCTGKHQTMLDVRHAIELLAFKHRSVERAEIIARSQLPAPLLALRDRLLEHDRARAGRTFVVVLRLLLTYSSEVVAECVSQALICGTLDPAAIALLVRQRTSPLPPAAPLLALRAPDGTQRPVVDLARYDLAVLSEGRP
jgi:transposase